MMSALEGWIDGPFERGHFRFWHLADMLSRFRDVRF
jgi:hypothetical protein